MTANHTSAATTDILARLMERQDDGEMGVRVDHLAPDLADAISEIEQLREQRIYLVAALREARPLMSDGEIAFRFDAPGTRGEAILLAAFAGADSGRSEP